MKYFAGLDGGQSATSAVIGDEQGRILGRGTAGPADEVAQDRGSTKLRDALSAALADAVQHASLPKDVQFEAIVAGMSGYEGRVYGVPSQLPANRFEIVHDTIVAHAGALGGKPGVVAICGTGSVAYASDGRQGEMVGGWGYLFGDEGSAFWLVRSLLVQAMGGIDAGAPVAATAPLLTFFGKPSLRALGRAFYSGEISRAQLAAFAPQIVMLAEDGDESAVAIVQEGAASIVTIVRNVMARCGMTSADVAFAGGMFKSTTYAEQIAQRLRRDAPGARHVPARYDAAAGALLLAYRSGGAPVADLSE